MIHTHNPVMQRLEEMAKLWQQQVKSHHRLTRWMLQPEESRMYEGFCRWEASQHGFLDNLFLFFYTPFQSSTNYSYAIMQNWLTEWDGNEQQRNMLHAAGVQGAWDVAIYREAINNNYFDACNVLLPQMLQSYRTWLGVPQTDMVLALLPKEMESPAGFNIWINNWMQQQSSQKLQLLLLDHTRQNYWGKTFEAYRNESCSLYHDLRMQQAVQEISTAGAATDPHAYFRKCMFEMGDAAGKRDVERLHEWGQKAIEAAKKNGDKNLLGTAYITYAGMLFNFKKHEKINGLLDEGLQLCHREITAGNEAMKSLLLQYYAYKGAHCQLKKEYQEALYWFMKMGDEAVQSGLYAQAVSSYYKAFVFADYKNRHTEKNNALLAAVQLTGQLQKEEIQSSEYPFIAYAFVQENIKDDSRLKEVVEQKMIAAFGSDWMDTVAEMKENYTKKKRRQAEHAVLTEE